MTTQITILNRGNKAVEVTGGTSGTPVTIQPNRHADLYLTDQTPVTVTEIEVTPYLGGGSGEEE